MFLLFINFYLSFFKKIFMLIFVKNLLKQQLIIMHIYLSY
ncbi:hypothetical protein J610_0648 [Acinetobacter sp. 723929]|nr:hypothetical protein ACINWC136_2159 [Acinetobacter pittii]EXA84256.1 hypothetical protein J508_4021 [Acinetobacter sp. 1289694]EXB77133.1 hypothetical protein J551_2059 [Acinetobacter sp. 1475718]EXC29227.1 hypothetical protein J536_0920 [Acinetobacter sp. 809848]EXG32597.1 hypothetical protein J733_1091 [Acinetobacter sp. 263903-2]EXI18930.1 hypothetical protein J610_0648 [Acinetobacter sp. 723929]EXS01921.1 hypothetical protein J687_0843 [Acinetobacter sp. 225588]EXS10760.1 hypothetical